MSVNEIMESSNNEESDSNQETLLFMPIEQPKDPLSPGLRRSQFLKRSRKRPKVESDWNDEDINKLIFLVEFRRPIWDKGSDEYKLPKDHLWDEIQEAFEEKFSSLECKAKWTNLRVTFNTNLARFRSSKSVQGADEKKQINWRFFETMLFLVPTDVPQMQSFKRSRKRPKVESEWNDEEVKKLISLVEFRRSIWDKGSDEYKLPKEYLWNEIQEAFEEKFSSLECKAKWANLRVTFNTNLARYRSSKSVQGVDIKKQINWRFFETMLFLLPTDVFQSTQSSSLMELFDADTDQSVLAELESTVLPSPSTSLPDPNRKRRKGSSTPPFSPLPDFKATAAHALAVMSKPEAKEPKNKYQVFGEYIASELQNLPAYQAEYVQRKVNRLFLDVMDEAELLPQPSQQTK